MLYSGEGCVMGVDQGNGLHIVIKMPPDENGVVVTVRVYHQEVTDALFSHLDHFMNAYKVKACVIDALPNQHAARAFARRFPGRVYLAYYGETQKGMVDWGHDTEHVPMAMINRTDMLDAWRDAHQMGTRRIPRLEGEGREYARQLTNIVRLMREHPDTGQKHAVWRKKAADDHYAHADAYAEVALKRLNYGLVRATIIGGDDEGWEPVFTRFGPRW
jgi:hypothetical protein